MRTVGVVTTSRADYGIYLPILKRIQSDPDLKLRLLVTGMHLSPEFGMTARAIEEDGFEIASKVEMLLSSDTPAGISKSIGLGVIGFSQAYSDFRPDILLVLGDRFEMLAAAVAAMPFKIPVAHIHGGELTEGAIDESIRHSITKMSHLHFASTETYAKRIIQMGEEPWRVTVSGAPGLDNLKDVSLLTMKELQDRYSLNARGRFLIATYHPVTLEYEQTEMQMRELLAALDESDENIVFTYPNADTCGRSIIQMLEEFSKKREKVDVVMSMGTQGYFSLMNHAAAMIGNSSSGIIEAASFKLPVVNIGNRQLGRVRGKNVIDVGYNRSEILAGIRKALSPEFRESLGDLVNPYGDCNASERIVKRLKEAKLDEGILRKRFYNK